MAKVQPYFEEEIKKTIKTIEEKKPEKETEESESA